MTSIAILPVLERITFSNFHPKSTCNISPIVRNLAVDCEIDPNGLNSQCIMISFLGPDDRFFPNPYDDLVGTIDPGASGLLRPAMAGKVEDQIDMLHDFPPTEHFDQSQTILALTGLSNDPYMPAQL